MGRETCTYANEAKVMRKQPASPPQTITPKQLDHVITQVREYRLITPLYGGGVNPNEADPVTSVRATEIRGHLRFWWRASRGGRFNSNTTALKKEEDAIWGKAYEKGDKEVPLVQTIQIMVDVEKAGESIKPFYMERKRVKPINNIPGYAAFPLQSNQDEQKKPEPYIPCVQKDVSFTLTISYPQAHSEDIEAALWAWETFGGLGARTRRGFGALHLLAIDGKPYRMLPASHNVERWIREKLSFYVEAGSFQDDIPHLSKEIQLAVTAPHNDPMWVWNKLINSLRNFRQYKDVRGHNVWPEAKAIRSLPGNTSQSHPQKFPRAAFGLPIIFHFTGANAPTDTTLKEQGENKEEKSKERFASPLILRPLLCNDNRVVGLALLLEGSRVDLEHLVLEEQKEQKKAPYYVQGTLTKLEAQSIEVLKGETNVLQAFMKSLRGV
jgi:CRISPR-associated protein Cmr1